MRVPEWHSSTARACQPSESIIAIANTTCVQSPGEIFRPGGRGTRVAAELANLIRPGEPFHGHQPLHRKSPGSVRRAQRLATRLGNQQVDVEHLLLALLDQEGGLATSILSKADVSPDALKLRVQRELERLPQGQRPAAAGPDLRHQPAQPPAWPAGRGRGQEAQGRLRLRRAPAAGHDRRHAARPAGFSRNSASPATG